uniref:Zona pellucida sperm-binding protein 3 n=1 Tax=Malurus cyaneus samueli TaxID=2593467 RepID=A0A8C5X7W7_9PASS
MEQDWSADRALSGVRLGDVLHVQAEVGSHSHVPLRLFVDSCVAALSPGAASEPQYSVIDFHGCLLDGRWDDASSAFVSPRPRPDVLRFRLDAFRFSGVSKGMGTGDICGCCERGTCGDLREPRQRQRQRQRRHGDSAGEGRGTRGHGDSAGEGRGTRGHGDREGTVGTAWCLCIVSSSLSPQCPSLSLNVPSMSPHCPHCPSLSPHCPSVSLSSLSPLSLTVPVPRGGGRS